MTSPIGPQGPSKPDQNEHTNQDRVEVASIDSAEQLSPPTGSVEPFRAGFHMSEYSQMNPKWGFKEGTHRSMCGIISMKAALDHYAYISGGDGPRPYQILEEIQAEPDSWQAAGIDHAAEVRYLTKQGLLAWRRNWDAPSADPNWFVENEGYSPQQLQAVTEQQAAEAPLAGDKRAAIRQSIITELDKQTPNPVIASMKPGYSGNKGRHQVVIHGWERDASGQEFVIVMDPEPEPGPPGTNARRDPVDHFFNFFNNQAIFMRRRPSAGP